MFEKDDRAFDETLCISSLKLLGGFSEEEYAQIGKEIVEWLMQRSGYPTELLVKVVAS